MPQNKWTISKPPPYNKFHWTWLHSPPPQTISLETLQQVATLLPGIVYIELDRADTVAQTVSYLFSRKTNYWQSTFSEGYSSFSMPFNEDELLEIYSQMKCLSVERKQFLANKRHITIEYSDMIADPIKTVENILAFAEYPQTLPDMELVRQRKMHNPCKSEHVELLRKIILATGWNQ